MIKKIGKALTRADIMEIEVNLGFTFPKDFTEYYLSYNGGIPERRFFYSEAEDIEIEVQVFLPLKNQCWDNLVKTAEEKYLLFKEKSPLMTFYFPFANDYGANPICVNLENGKVYIVYMDLGELKDKCFHCLAESFSDFVEGLSENSMDN